MANLYSSSDAEYRKTLRTFIDLVREHLEELGMDEDDLDEIVGSQTRYETKVATAAQTRQAAKAATEDKNAERAATQTVHRRLVYKILGQPGVPAGLLASLSIKRRDRPTRGEPNVPTGLVVERRLDGTHKLVWDGSGNPKGTLYVIGWHLEEGEFAYLHTVDALSYRHRGLAAGTKATYRVRAVRGDFVSAWSDTATAYGSA